MSIALCPPPPHEQNSSRREKQIRNQNLRRDLASTMIITLKYGDQESEKSKNPARICIFWISGSKGPPLMLSTLPLLCVSP
ncbi:hypothetical protein AB205_0157040 [Aquarana catesbeiana]|uniref:Uncharacterized protein n=1 Tax=Aquarana catesbeiana TaxID=8400 RepID=A0A2G9RNC8_AQUCT|nr:hypothetical protein AB205_0157040 [Aquarana catesbeiana]